MFKELGQLTSLMKNLPKIQENMEQLRQKMGQIVAEGSSGGGMVTVKVNGRMEMISCSIADESMSDKEMLEDLVRGATNQAMEKARVLVAEETSKLAGGLGLPPGMNLPGFGE